MQLNAEQSQRLLDIARAAIRQTLEGQTTTPVPETDPVLMSPAGCFVSLHQRSDHQLRGCVGRLDANGPLAEVVRQTAVSVLNDPRFTGRRVQLNELANLEIELSILSPLAAAKNPLDFDLQNDGLFLIISNRSGCFLPQVARQTGWNKEQLLDRLCMEKLGFPAKMWQHPAARLQKFTAAILGPVPFENPGGAWSS
jgi:AmmeMemoRadiSam system protein A